MALKIKFMGDLQTAKGTLYKYHLTGTKQEIEDYIDFENNNPKRANGCPMEEDGKTPIYFRPEWMGFARTGTELRLITTANGESYRTVKTENQIIDEETDVKAKIIVQRERFGIKGTTNSKGSDDDENEESGESAPANLEKQPKSGRKAPPTSPRTK